MACPSRFGAPAPTQPVQCTFYPLICSIACVLLIYPDRLVHATLWHARGAAQRDVQLAPLCQGAASPSGLKRRPAWGSRRPIRTYAI